MEEQMQSCTCINVCLFGATHIGCSHGCSHTVIPNVCVKTCKGTFFGHSCPLGILLLRTSTLWCLKIHTQISTWFISGRKAFGLWAPNFWNILWHTHNHQGASNQPTKFTLHSLEVAACWSFYIIEEYWGVHSHNTNLAESRELPCR